MGGNVNKVQWLSGRVLFIFRRNKFYFVVNSVNTDIASWFIFHIIVCSTVHAELYTYLITAVRLSNKKRRKYKSEHKMHSTNKQTFILFYLIQLWNRIRRHFSNVSIKKIVLPDGFKIHWCREIGQCVNFTVTACHDHLTTLSNHNWV